MTNNCLICNSKLTALQIFSETPICEFCLHSFSFVNSISKKSKCNTCEKKLKRDTSGLCEDCQYWTRKFPEVQLIPNRALLYYNKFAHEVMHKAKFEGDVILWEVFIYLMRQYGKFPKGTYQKIPSHEERIQSRDFEHLEYILESLSFKRANILWKTNNSASQLRAENLNTRRQLIDAFEVSNKDGNTKNLVLFDDVYTTGTTIKSCVELLSQNKIEVKQSVTLFRAELLFEV